MPEYLLVKPSIVGNPDAGYETVYHAYDRFHSITAARRWGIAEFDHDDFNLAIVEGSRLIDLTWMGEQLEPDGCTHADLVEVARQVYGLDLPIGDRCGPTSLRPGEVAQAYYRCAPCQRREDEVLAGVEFIDLKAKPADSDRAQEQGE